MHGFRSAESSTLPPDTSVKAAQPSDGSKSGRPLAGLAHGSDAIPSQDEHGENTKCRSRLLNQALFRLATHLSSTCRTVGLAL